jgi:hypothetical protein
MPGGNGKGQGGGACDASALASSRVVVDAACDCAAATRHGAYVSCVQHAVKDGIGAGTVTKSCRGALKKGAARSTCGKPGAVACCRTKASGTTKCSIKANASACTAPSGGASCVSPLTSCLDACTTTGCAASPSGAFLDRIGF